MTIKQLDISDVGSLAPVYNAQTADIPHCYSVTSEEFELGFRFERYADEPYDNLHSEKLLISEKDGKIVGFADVAVVDVEEEGERRDEGLIRFLTYESGHRPVGQALLTEAENYLRDLGMKHVRAFRISYGNDFCYRFYHLGFGLVSDRVGHISALLKMNGYEVEGGEVFMDQPEYTADDPTPIDPNVEINVTRKPGRGRLPGLMIHAFLNGKEVGECSTLSMGEYCRNDEAQDWVFVKWLGVEEEYQGKGWGRFLLQKALFEAKKLAYRNTAISTNIVNHRAQLFYTNYGYKVVDIAYQFSRAL